jgi:hypothetical protein
MMADDDEVTGKGGCRDHMAMQVPDTIDDSSVFWPYLGRLEVAFDPDVVVAGKYVHRYPLPECPENFRQLVKFLTGDRGDTVLDIPKKEEGIGVGTVNDLHQTLKPGSAPASEMEPVGSKVCFDPEMKVSDDEMALVSFDKQRGTFADKCQVHRGLT